MADSVFPKRLLLLPLAALATACAGSTNADPNPPPEPQVLFFDDFAGSSLDRTKWNVEVWSTTVNDEQQAYVDSSATLYLVQGADAQGAENGALAIHPRHVPNYQSPGGRRFDFISGRITTQNRFQFTYGTAAARIRMTAGAGLWPAFWALGAGDWPATGEIDVMENVGDPAWTSVALHGSGYSGNTPLASRHTFPAGTDATSWHVYSVDWSADSLVFRVDGNAVYRASRRLVTQYGPWAFDNPKFLILNFALGGGYPFGVNGVRTPYYGLPQETVQKISAGQARMLVDWVRVTGR